MSAGIRAGASNDAYLQVNGSDVIKFEQNGQVTLNKPLAVASAANPLVYLTKSVGQAVPHNTETKIDFVAQVDTASGWNGASARWQPPVAGWYWVSLAVSVQIGSGSFTDILTILKKAGTAVIGGSEFVADSTLMTSTLAVPVFLNGTTDYLETFVYQTNSGALSSTARANGSFFSATYLHP